MRSYKFKVTNSSDCPGEFVDEVCVVVANVDGGNYTDDQLNMDTEFVIMMINTLKNWYHGTVEFVGVA